MTPPILGIWASQISGHLWAPAGAYDALATVTVPSGGAASITFAGIPTGYKHLQIRALAKSTNTSTGSNWIVRANSDTGTNYSLHQLYADGSSVGSGGGANTDYIWASQTTGGDVPNIFSATVMDILDYADTNKYKTFRFLGAWDANGSGQIRFGSGSWRSTSAINTLTITVPSWNLAQYSQFALYGCK